jgi:uncharacterized RDD family membrane protein YckC
VNNPYIPPEADLSSPNNPGVGADAPRYAGFMVRLGAYLLDALILLPMIALGLFLGHKSRLFLAYGFIPLQLVNLWYYIYLVSKNGGTPGKRLRKLKITLLDGAPVTLKRAAVRYLVFVGLITIASIGLNFSVLNMSDAEFHSLDYMERSQRLVQLAPAWYQPVFMVAQIWFWLDLVTMLFNRKRRTLHDHIAGTVVVRE